LQALLTSYKNVRFKYIYVPEFTANSPIQDFIISEKFNRTQFYNDHLSDALRLVALWRYGGVYLDNDFFVTKSLDILKPNYATKDGDHFNSAVLSLDYEGFGHQLAELMMEYEK
jgi:mannosyltransferase OCH1-like enzyme